MFNEKMRKELEDLTERGEGKLKAADLVRYARENKDSELHKHIFKDDDRTAAHKWRLLQARRVIRCWVEYWPQEQKNVRVVVSVPSDRVILGAYRRTSDVVGAGNERLRGEMVEEALKKISHMRESYNFLPEMMPFFDRIDVMIIEYRAQLGQRAVAG